MGEESVGIQKCEARKNESQRRDNFMGNVDQFTAILSASERF